MQGPRYIPDLRREGVLWLPCARLPQRYTCDGAGDDPHRYVWSGYALRDPSGLDAGAEPGEVAGALRDGVLAAGTITARYGR